MSFAWARLVASSLLFVLGSWKLAMFYRSRNILDIRARSARLVVICGLGIMCDYFILANGACRILWGVAVDSYLENLVRYFALPLIMGSYICRTIRLVMLYKPKVKHAFPWLMPERNHILILLFIGVLFLAIPTRYRLGNNVNPNDELDEHALEQVEIIQGLKIGIAVVLASLYPLVRNVDDLFNISRELVVAMATLLAFSVCSKLVIAHGSTTVKTCLSTANLTLLMILTLFLVTIVEPVWRLQRDYKDGTLVSSCTCNINDVRRRWMNYGNSRPDSGNISNAIKLKETSEHESVDDTTPRGPDQLNAFFQTSSFHNEDWSYERLLSIPVLASAFEEFARKALCHESVLFLADVSRYQHGDFSSASVLGMDTDEFGGFCFISKTYIVPGSPEEVNISFSEKMKILNQVRLGRLSFDELTANERSGFFNHAYNMVRDMLEGNLLERFLRSNEFRYAITLTRV